MAQDRFTHLIKIDKNGTKWFEDWRCSRCGGAGGADAWAFTGYTCWECGGTGMRHSPKIYKEYTPEYEEKLKAKRLKAQEKRIAEKREKAQELNAEFYTRNGFDQDGNMWIVLGNSFEIKEELKALGCKFSSQLSCWHTDHELEGYETLKLNASEMYEIDDAGVYLWQWLRVNETRELIDLANKKLKASESASSIHVGTVGEKIEIKAELTAVHWYDTRINYHNITTWFYTFKDESGNVFIWKTQKCIDEMAGDHVMIKGTIKAHSEYNDVKQTELMRCKITKEES